MLLAWGVVFSQTSKSAVIALTPTIDLATPKVTLTWSNSTPAYFVLFRREKDSPNWYVLLEETGSTTNTFTDNSVTVGQTYEYGIQRVIGNVFSAGYAMVPLEAPVVDSRGNVAVFVEEALETPLAVELERFRNDLAGDGWVVYWHSVPSSATVASVKSQVVADHDNVGLNAVFLFGEIPVPYSGNTAWDGHDEHTGAWPADSYYGDVDSDQWTDATVNTAMNPVAPARPETVNVPGDGKFDQDLVATTSEIPIGRVDFSNISPATFGTTELELYRRYLNKNHKWRSKQYTVPTRALVDDNFGYFGGEAFAANGYRNGNPLVGPTNVFDGDFFNDTDGDGYLFAYGCGGGTYTSASGVGTSAQFGSDSINVVFSQLFGSYHGDWDYSPNPFMMSALASKGGILTCSWAGRPHWFTHHLGAGETIGYSTLQTMNACETPGYFNIFGDCGAHVTLLGDPTVRAQIVAPVSNVTAAQFCDEVEVSWAASPQSNVIGYHVYRSSQADGFYDRLTTVPVTTLAFTDGSPSLGNNSYAVKAVVREETPSGIFFNTSTGIITSINIGSTTPPDINIPASVTLTCATPSYLLNPCGPGVQCHLKGAGGTSTALPFTITQPGSYTVVVIDAATGCSASETMIVLLDNIPPATPTTSLGTSNCQTQTVQLFGNSTTPGVSYAWTGPNGFTSSQQNPTVSSSGMYTLTVTGSNGCTSSSTLMVPPFTAPDISATGGVLTCASPSVQIQGNSNTPNVTYAWTGPNGFTSNLQNPMVNVAGTYQLTVTSSDGCTASASAAVTLSGNLPQASPTASGTLTCSVTQVTIMANPDMAGYTFAWTGPNGFTSASENPVVTAPGPYAVLVTNPATGCAATLSVTVGFSGNLPQASPMPSGALTCVVTQVTIMANPGMAGYSFAWTGPNGFTSAAQNPVVTEPGLYSVLVTNPATGCSATYTATVTEIVPPTINFSLPDVELNCTSTTAVIDLTAVCGLPGFACTLNGQPIPPGPIVINQPGNYEVVVTHLQSGCTASDVLNVTSNTALPNLTVTGDATLDCADDLTTLTANSTTPGVIFFWTGLNGNPSQTVSAGSYTVTATAPNGCTTTQTTTVTAPPALVISVATANVDCAGFSTLTINVTGGTAPYTYQTMPPSPVPPSTIFSVLVTDANDCTATTTGTTGAVVPTEFSVSSTDETVLGANDGTATVTVTGGTPPFTYEWSNGQTGPTATNLAPGSYDWVVTDANGCEFTGTVTIEAGVNATSDLPGLRRLALSPNPTNGRFVLAIELENPLAVQVELLDVSGRILSKTSLETVLEKTWDFDLTASPSGVYFCKVTAEGNVVVLKVVKGD